MRCKITQLYVASTNNCVQQKMYTSATSSIQQTVSLEAKISKISFMLFHEMTSYLLTKPNS